jgi:hypothetical protein
MFRHVAWVAGITVRTGLKYSHEKAKGPGLAEATTPTGNEPQSIWHEYRVPPRDRKVFRS